VHNFLKDFVKLLPKYLREDLCFRDLRTGCRLGLQVDLPGDLTNLWADDRQIVALNKALDSPAPIVVVSMKL
jgi:hypothetical protein